MFRFKKLHKNLVSYHTITKAKTTAVTHEITLIMDGEKYP